VGDARSWLRAGTVGKPHGLDGSFYVGEPKADLLIVGAEVTVAGDERTIARRAGLDARPIVRLEGCEDRAAAKALRGEVMLVGIEHAPPLEEDEWYAHELEGCQVGDGDLEVGVVARLIALPSCEVLEVKRAEGGPDLLVPLVKDAVRSVDPAGRRIDVDLRFLGER
jgi:16S rRNA processing protein RimM